MGGKSTILLIGGTGYIGKFLVEASAKAGHPTLAVVRESTFSSPAKSKLIEKMKTMGVRFLIGDLNDQVFLVKAIKQADVVITAVGSGQSSEQENLIAAIKEAGNVKRFFPSEFGNDADRVQAVEPARSMYASKANIRRIIEREGIPHTFVACNFFAGYFLANLAQPGGTSPPKDKAIVLGDGSPKVVFNKEEDIAAYTIRAVDDPATLNKILYIKPPNNMYSFNDLISLWEKKIGKKLERIYMSEEQILKRIKDTGDVVLSIEHSAFVKGDQTNFEIDRSFGVEASELYPDITYTTVDEYLDQLAQLKL